MRSFKNRGLVSSFVRLLVLAGGLGEGKGEGEEEGEGEDKENDDEEGKEGGEREGEQEQGEEQLGVVEKEIVARPMATRTGPRGSFDEWDFNAQLPHGIPQVHYYAG